MAASQATNVNKEFSLNSEYITEQFLENEPGEIEFQYFGEVYAVLSELDEYDGEEQERLMAHVDNFATETPVNTGLDSTFSAEEIAESYREFSESKFYNADKDPLSSEEGFYQMRLEQSAAFLGDRLRYLEFSDHAK